MLTTARLLEIARHQNQTPQELRQLCYLAKTPLLDYQRPNFPRCPCCKAKRTWREILGDTMTWHCHECSHVWPCETYDVDWYWVEVPELEIK